VIERIVIRRHCCSTAKLAPRVFIHMAVDARGWKVGGCQHYGGIAFNRATQGMYLRQYKIVKEELGTRLRKVMSLQTDFDICVSLRTVWRDAL
jgi:hypothetical protein